MIRDFEPLGPEDLDEAGDCARKLFDLAITAVNVIRSFNCSAGLEASSRAGSRVRVVKSVHWVLRLLLTVSSRSYR